MSKMVLVVASALLALASSTAVFPGAQSQHADPERISVEDRYFSKPGARASWKKRADQRVGSLHSVRQQREW